MAEVRSAIPLTDDQQPGSPTRSRKATGKRVEVKVIVDPSVLGGLVAQVGDTVIDGSVRRRLEQLRNAALGDWPQENDMAELTINTDDITAALRKNLEGFTPDYAERAGRDASSRSATASPASRACPTRRSTSCSSSRTAPSASP